MQFCKECRRRQASIDSLCSFCKSLGTVTGRTFANNPEQIRSELIKIGVIDVRPDPRLMRVDPQQALREVTACIYSLEKRQFPVTCKRLLEDIDNWEPPAVLVSQ